jgi:hypothetical protein
MGMGGTPDFCLTCGRQTPGGGYCSKACCPPNPEKLCSSAAVPPTSAEFGKSRPWSGIDKVIGFYLPPAINFDTYRSANKESAPLTNQSSFKAPQESEPIAQKQSKSSSRIISIPKQLSTQSSSEWSDLLIEENSTQGDRPSDQAIEELRYYASSFDRTRNWKRRVSTK